MYNFQIPLINYGINRTGKVIVSLGCSFVQGQGAFDDEIYDRFHTDYLGMGYALRVAENLSPAEKEKLTKEFKTIKIDKATGQLDMSEMEHKNSFVSVLCNTYFGGEYTAINLGMRGTGNRGQVKELYFRPEIDWHKVKEVIVLYCPSGMERFDFVNDLWDEHFHFKAMWPNKGEDKELWRGYANTVYSEKQAIIEQIGHVQELLTWCKLKNAKLVITPSFDRRYDKDVFNHELAKHINRGMDQNISEIMEPSIFGPNLISKNHVKLADLWPWENMFRPDGHDTFANLVLSKIAHNLEDKHDYFFQFQGKRSEGGWITPCSHPGQKGHDLFASLLYNHIRGL
jgi:hypothetical protein